MLKKGGKSIGGRQKSEQHSQTKAIHGIKAISLCWADYGRGELCGTNQYCHVTSDPSQIYRPVHEFQYGYSSCKAHQQDVERSHVCYLCLLWSLDVFLQSRIIKQFFGLLKLVIS